ncbi:MAG TPA: flavodoxin family protein [Ruminiclostridium sp.]|nr:flavodoxin family protein [Ruminiclostridium sp.]
MKTVVIYGTMHKGSTYHCTQLLLERLSAEQDMPVKEFFLPRDMPHFCNSCFSCFNNGESTCPHYESMRPIVAALDEADLIILSSPCYVLDVSGQMKAFLDHLGYRWMPHRPNASMFRKVGIVISTAAGSGTSATNKTMKRSLTFWGVKRIFSFGANVRASKWEEIKPELQQKIKNRIQNLSSKVLNTSRKIEKLRPRLFTVIIFNLMKSTMKEEHWNKTDCRHWKSSGWLDGKRPWNENK